MKLIETGVGISEEVVGRICSGAFAVAAAILPGLSKNWEWDVEDLGPLVPEWSFTGCTNDKAELEATPAAAFA